MPVAQAAATELMLVRHAPAANGGRLAGRLDVPADCSDMGAFVALRERLAHCDRRIMSPALRCAQTAEALWPGQPLPEIDSRLWEQDFGAWENLAYADLPDLGPLPVDALAESCPPGGESFAGLCARSAPAFQELLDHGGRIAIVAHAGIVRAALALALGAPGRALTFQIAPLSLTHLTALPDAGWSIGTVNWTAQP